MRGRAQAMEREPALEREIEGLKERLLSLGGYVERALSNAIWAMERRDAAAAREVIEGDAEIDRAEVEIEEECLKLLALQRPTGFELRFVVTVLKVNNDLERIGDHAASLAEHVVLVSEHPQVELAFDFTRMARRAQEMLRDGLDALVFRDAARAASVCAADDEIDEINRNMYRDVERLILKNPELTPAYVNHVGVSRCLERVADLATNIAEDVIYLTTGRIARH
jgi:phosphate transport system protein